MILLPNKCSCSEPSVYPSDWDKCGQKALKKNWYVQYYFYDPEFEKPKYCVIKAGVNRFKTISERRAAIKALLKDDLEHLKEGWNPILGRMVGEFEFKQEICPTTPTDKAMELAFKRIKASKSTISDLKGIKNEFIKSLRQLRIGTMSIDKIKRKHVRAALENMAENNSYSNGRYNKCRSYLLMLFKELIRCETIESNPVKEIEKLKETKRLRTILSDTERKKINRILFETLYEFWRLIHIFFHAGCRETEIMMVRKSDVYLHRNEFKITVQKNRTIEEQIRPINSNVKHLWVELYNMAGPNDFIFSNGLIPGPKNIRADQISRRWKRHVKDKMGITVDFYALKHLHTDIIAESEGIQMASAANGHKSDTMVLNHYAVGHKKRQLESLKKLKVGF